MLSAHYIQQFRELLYSQHVSGEVKLPVVCQALLKKFLYRKYTGGFSLISTAKHVDFAKDIRVLLEHNVKEDADFLHDLLCKLDNYLSTTPIDKRGEFYALWVTLLSEYHPLIDPSQFEWPTPQITFLTYESKKDIEKTLKNTKRAAHDYYFLYCKEEKKYYFSGFNAHAEKVEGAIQELDVFKDIKDELRTHIEEALSDKRQEGKLSEIVSAQLGKPACVRDIILHAHFINDKKYAEAFEDLVKGSAYDATATRALSESLAAGDMTLPRILSIGKINKIFMASKFKIDNDLLHYLANKEIKKPSQYHNIIDELNVINEYEPSRKLHSAKKIEEDLSTLQEYEIPEDEYNQVIQNLITIYKIDPNKFTHVAEVLAKPDISKSFYEEFKAHVLANMSSCMSALPYFKISEELHHNFEDAVKENLKSKRSQNQSNACRALITRDLPVSDKLIKKLKKFVRGDDFGSTRSHACLALYHVQTNREELVRFLEKRLEKDESMIVSRGAYHLLKKLCPEDATFYAETFISRMQSMLNDSSCIHDALYAISDVRFPSLTTEEIQEILPTLLNSFDKLSLSIKTKNSNGRIMLHDHSSDLMICNIACEALKRIYNQVDDNEKIIDALIKYTEISNWIHLGHDNPYYALKDIEIPWHFIEKVSDLYDEYGAQPQVKTIVPSDLPDCDFFKKLITTLENPDSNQSRWLLATVLPQLQRVAPECQDKLFQSLISLINSITSQEGRTFQNKIIIDAAYHALVSIDFQKSCFPTIMKTFFQEIERDPNGRTYTHDFTNMLCNFVEKLPQASQVHITIRLKSMLNERNLTKLLPAINKIETFSEKVKAVKSIDSIPQDIQNNILTLTC